MTSAPSKANNPLIPVPYKTANACIRGCLSRVTYQNVTHPPSKQQIAETLAASIPAVPKYRCAGQIASTHNPPMTSARTLQRPASESIRTCMAPLTDGFVRSPFSVLLLLFRPIDSSQQLHHPADQPQPGPDDRQPGRSPELQIRPISRSCRQCHRQCHRGDLRRQLHGHGHRGAPVAIGCGHGLPTAGYCSTACECTKTRCSTLSEETFSARDIPGLSRNSSFLTSS